jgi:hypothetical protein
MSDKTRNQIMENLAVSGGVALQGLNNADKLWEARKGDSAKTIQDFATAVAKGMQLFYAGSNGQISDNWAGTVNETNKDKTNFSMMGVNK